MDKLSSKKANNWDLLFDFQDAFDLLQEYYPLRAAAHYLRSLTRIWVDLLEKNKRNIIVDDAFIRLYLDALLAGRSHCVQV